MIQTILRLLKRIFPMPQVSAMRRFEHLEQALCTISEQQKVFASQQQLAAEQQRSFDAQQLLLSAQNQSIAKELSDINTAVQSLDELGRSIAKLKHQLGFDDNQSEAASQTSLSAELKSAKSQLEQLFHATEQINGALDEIMHGDIFRRIEFLQGKTVFLETMLQRNLISEQDQKCNTTYSFILRMRKRFSLMELSSPSPYIRIGRSNDGGYVMLDDFRQRKIAYSIGIADDVSWDLDMANRSIDVYMYDHTIAGLPMEHERFHYFQVGLGCARNIEDPRLKSLSQLMTENGHMDEYGMILKVDIEGAEWDVLCDIEEDILKHFSQIVFEFHGLIFPENEEKICRALDKLNRTHQLVHLHPNNYGSYLLLGGALLPELIEGTYLLRDEYTFCAVGGNPSGIPSKLDEINCTYLPDIFLGAWDTQGGDCRTDG